MRAALVITDEDFYEPTGYARAWVTALEDQGCEVERLARLPSDWATTGTGPRRFDLGIAHVLVEEVAAFAPPLQVAAVLEAAGVPLLNPVGALVASSDKLVTHAVWAAAGVPQPRTFDLARLDTWPQPGRPMILKPSLGDGARRIELVHDLAAAREAVAAWAADDTPDAPCRHRQGAALLQEWVEEPTAIRLFAGPDDVSPGYAKAREEGKVVTHGTTYPEVFEPSADLARLARRMVATLGGGLMGVDVLAAPDGRLLALEANGPFGFDVTDPDQGRWVAQVALRVARRRSVAA